MHVFDIASLTILATLPIASTSKPRAKIVFEGMDVMFHNGAPWDDWPLWSQAMAPYFEDDFIYDFTYPFNKTKGLHHWFQGEHTAYNEAFGGYNSSVMLSIANDSAMTCAAYHLARWTKDFAGVPAPENHPVVRVRDLDFYALRDDKIHYNWCMIDLVDILQQAGYQVLPPAILPDDGLYAPPRSMDGLPAPNSNFVEARHTAEATDVFRCMIYADFVEQEVTAQWWSEEMVWYGPAGIGTARRRQDYIEHFLMMMRSAFSTPSLHLDGVVCEGVYCGAHFHLQVTHSGCWLGLPATGRAAMLRFGLHARLGFKGGKYQVHEAWLQLDIPAAFTQFGVDLLARTRLQNRVFQSCSDTVLASSRRHDSQHPTLFLSCAAMVVFVLFILSVCAFRFPGQRHASKLRGLQEALAA